MNENTDNQREVRVPVNISGYLNLVAPFVGDNSAPKVDEFFEQIEEIGLLAGWGKAEKLIIAKNKCKGEAAAYIREIKYSDDLKSYDKFKQNLEARFSSKEPLALRMSKMISCKQVVGESVRQYTARLERLFYDSWGACAEEGLSEVRNKTLLSLFLTGLSPKIKRFVLSHCPDTYEAAKNRALIEEGNEGIISLNTRSVNMNVSAEDDRDAKTLIEKLCQSIEELKIEHRHTIEGLSNEISRLDSEIKSRQVNQQTFNTNKMTGRTSDLRKNIRCYNCNGIGHIARECNVRKRPNVDDQRRERDEYYVPRGKNMWKGDRDQTTPKQTWKNNSLGRNTENLN